MDQGPSVVADTDSVTEGASVTKDAANGVLSDDTAGADGWASTGAIVGVAAGDTNINLDDISKIATEIQGQYGKLTLNADGSYTYVATANAITADAQDVFTYSVKDGDGDLTNTTLTIDVADVAMDGTNTEDTVYEAGIDGIGTESSTDKEKVINGDLNLATGTTVDAQSGTASFGTWSIDANGKFNYTLTTKTQQMLQIQMKQIVLHTLQKMQMEIQLQIQ